MPVPTAITDLSTTAASNFPAGSDSPSSLDDVQRAQGAFIAQIRDAVGMATGALVPATARTRFGAAASGANADITSLSALSTALSVAQGGTGVTASTGSGSNVLSTSPTLVTPLLDTPTSGALGNCTTTTQAVGDSTTKLANTAFVNPSFSKAASGYVKLPSGVIIQWGTAYGASPSASFPVSFPFGCYGFTITPTNASTSAPIPYLTSLTASYFAASFGGTSTTWVWMAVGY